MGRLGRIVWQLQVWGPLPPGNARGSLGHLWASKASWPRPPNITASNYLRGAPGRPPVFCVGRPGLFVGGPVVGPSCTGGVFWRGLVVGPLWPPLEGPVVVVVVVAPATATMDISSFGESLRRLQEAPGPIENQAWARRALISTGLCCVCTHGKAKGPLGISKGPPNL